MYRGTPPPHPTHTHLSIQSHNAVRWLHMIIEDDIKNNTVLNSKQYLIKQCYIIIIINMMFTFKAFFNVSIMSE